jgi:anti-sigma regulatory factor (Ser/Thr protein kinase)
MRPRGRIDLSATLEGTSAALEELMVELLPFASSEDRDAIELGAAEVLSNIVRHGYGGDAAGRIRMAWVAGTRRIELRFCDCGKPIPDVRMAIARETSLDFGDTRLDDLPESGLGLAFIRRMFHRVRYRSRGPVNRLRLVRKLR